MKINWTNNIPKEAGQYLCKFNRTSIINLVTVYYRDTKFFGGMGLEG